MTGHLWHFMRIASYLLVGITVCVLVHEPLHARNVIVYVADGLRAGSVNPEDAPTFTALQTRGVAFQNSHALFPTFTTPNASAIATGHYLGDTGDFSNTEYLGFTVEAERGKNTPTPFLENDAVLACADDYFNGNFLGEETLLACARSAGLGFSTAAIGKVGPVALQDVRQAASVHHGAPLTPTVVIDDQTGTDNGVPLLPEIIERLQRARLPLWAPDRSNGAPNPGPGKLISQQSNGRTGDFFHAGTLTPNTVQQRYFVDALTLAVLPYFRELGKPFVVVYWSRDPDGTQHYQGDSLNRLTPGINGRTSRAAVRNADTDLRQILDYLKDWGLADDTDVFVTSDHGFSTISRRDLDPSGAASQSESAKPTYRTDNSTREMDPGFLPPGFLALDLARHLQLALYDPNARPITEDGMDYYQLVKPALERATAESEQHPATGNALIGGDGKVAPATTARVVVAANGGSDLIYLLDKNPDTVRDIVQFLTEQDYVGGVFVAGAEKVPGALNLSDINLEGSAVLPREGTSNRLPLPTIIVSFRSFSIDAADPLQTAVTICDTPLQQGQGMHGSFSRADTFNFMAASGPDFKRSYTDRAPASNADVAITLAHVLGFTLPSRGSLVGRVLVESLTSGPPMVSFQGPEAVDSPVAANGFRTRLMVQRVGETIYFDEAGAPGRTVGLSTAGN